MFPVISSSARVTRLPRLLRRVQIRVASLAADQTGIFDNSHDTKVSVAPRIVRVDREYQMSSSSLA